MLKRQSGQVPGFQEREDSCIGGSRIGGLKTVRILTERDPGHYRRIGSLGGRKKGVKKGFALWDKEALREQGAWAGRKGKRKAARHYKPKEITADAIIEDGIKRLEAAVDAIDSASV